MEQAALAFARELPGPAVTWLAENAVKLALLGPRGKPRELTRFARVTARKPA